MGGGGGGGGGGESSVGGPAEVNARELKKEELFLFGLRSGFLLSFP